MANERIIETIEREIVPIIEGLGYEVVEVCYNRQGRSYHLSIFIHKKGGVSLDDCERVTHALDAPLEALDISNGASYVLNVSSPGLDRPIVSDRDYERNLGKVVEAHFHSLVDKKKRMKGTLSSFDGTTLTLLVNGKNVVLQRSNIRLLQCYIDFNRINNNKTFGGIEGND